MAQPKGNKKGAPKLNMQAAKRLLGYIMDMAGPRFVIVLISIVLSSLANVVGSLFLQILVDDYIEPMIGVANPVFTALLKVMLIMALIYVVGVLATYFYNRQMAIIGQKVQKKIRDDMFAHMETLPICYFDTHTHGDIMSRYTNDIDTLRQMITQSIPQLFSSIVTIVLLFLGMLYTSIPLTLIIVVMVLLMMRTMGKISQKSGKYFRQQQESLGEVNGYIEEMMNGQKVVKVFNYERSAEETFDKINENLRETAKHANTYANIMMPIMANLNNMTYVVVGIVGGVLSLTGISALSLGSIVSFLSLTKNFGSPIQQVSQQASSVIMALAGADRIFQLLDEESEEDNGYVTLVNAQYNAQGELVEASFPTGTWAWKHPHEDGSLTYAKVTGDVRFFDVDFSYDGKKTVLHNISMYAEPGQKVAFVGATGAGKTTITNLINRFYDIADGKIRYDGININKIRKSDLRRSLGVILQDVNLFTGTVMENIRYGNLDATDEEVISAAKLVGADSFITRLPNGYDTVLSGDGSGLSQGQRQLLSIARAAVADPPVMIMDEATSSIDTRTEKQVQSGMDALMMGRTVFVIAHRLSTIQNADVIMVMDKGRIVERGNHEELIAQKGRYYQLYTGAFETADEMEAETA